MKYDSDTIGYTIVINQTDKAIARCERMIQLHRNKVVIHEELILSLQKEIVKHRQHKEEALLNIEKRGTVKVPQSS